MKTLYLGYYDFPYHKSAQVLQDNKFVDYPMPEDDLEEFMYLYRRYEREEEQERKERLSKYFNEFDRIIVCEDGTFEVIK